MTNYSKKDVCAAFVLYNPDKEQFLRSLSSARSAGLSVVVVDNTPSRLLKFDIVSGVTYIANGDNLGIAKALNQAAEEARRLGFRSLLTIDQDSTFPSDFVERALSVFGLCDNVGIVGPTVKFWKSFKIEEDRKDVDNGLSFPCD